MTNKMFFEAVIDAAISDEVTEKATLMLEQLKYERETANSRNSKKKEAENAPLIEAILTALSDGHEKLTSEVAALTKMSKQKASVLLRKLVAENKVTVRDVKVPKKGTQKAYTLAVSE